jgi:DNA/RNA endonuclease YhcR with UshA esterase domain
MREQTLLKLALTSSVIGILVLFFLAEAVEVEETAIGKIDGLRDERVQVKGVLKRVAGTGNVTFLSIAAEEEVTVVLFGGPGNQSAGRLQPGENVAVTGMVSDYGGKREIIADIVRYIP